MLTLPADLVQVIVAFAPLFSKPVWEHAQLLLIGALLAPAKRTVTSALRVTGLSQEPQFQRYHRVLNRARWNALAASRILLGLLLALLPAGSAIVIGADDTIERRRGRKIKGLGCYRDPVNSSHQRVVKCFGLKWLCLMLLVRVPWSKRVWALPFLTCLCPWPGKQAATAHKTAIDRLLILVRLIRRWLRGPELVLVVDGSYAAVKLALGCVEADVTLCVRLRLDASLYHQPVIKAGRRGPRPRKGARQRSLQQWARRRDTPFEEIEVAWYGGARKKVQLFSRAGLWYRAGLEPVALRYVLVRDPEGRLADVALGCTKVDATPGQIIEWAVMRWSVEVTFEELRARLGMETQRQWSEKAIARTTPALLALFSLVVLMASRLNRDGRVPVNEAAWYSKAEATFSDCLALVRRHCWRARYLGNSASEAESVLIESTALNHLIGCLALAA